MPFQEAKFERFIEREISPELIFDLEKSKLTIDDKVNILLTKAGLKPASEIILIIKTTFEEKTIRHMREKEVNKALEIIKNLNLPFLIKEREVKKESYWTEKEPKIEKFFEREQMEILIGRSKEELDFLIKARETKSDELLGKAFGIPETAIEAFVGKRKKLDISSLPKKTRESDAFLFSSPTLSADNWQEEIKQGEDYAKFIKKTSPSIYKKMRKIALKRQREIVKED